MWDGLETLGGTFGALLKQILSLINHTVCILTISTHLEVPDLVVGDADGLEDAPLVVLLDHSPTLPPQPGVLRVAHVLACVTMRMISIYH